MVYGFQRDQLLVGNGSDDLLAMKYYTALPTTGRANERMPATS